MARGKQRLEVSPEGLVLLERAKGGDQTALPDLQAFLDDHPEIWRACGDLACHAERAWLELAAGNNLLARESIQRQMDQLRVDIEGANATPLEKLLVHRVVMCWLQVHLADMTKESMQAVGAW